MTAEEMLAKVGKHDIVNTISDLLYDYAQYGTEDLGELSDGMSGSIAISTKLNRYLD